MSQVDLSHEVEQDVVSRRPSFIKAEPRRGSFSSQKSDSSQESYASPRDRSHVVNCIGSIRSLKHLDTLAFDDPLVSSLMDAHVGQSPGSSSSGIRRINSVRSFKNLETFDNENMLVSAMMETQSGGIRQRLHLPAPQQNL